MGDEKRDVDGGGGAARGEQGLGMGAASTARRCKPFHDIRYVLLNDTSSEKNPLHTHAHRARYTEKDINPIANGTGISYVLVESHSAVCRRAGFSCSRPCSSRW